MLTIRDLLAAVRAAQGIPSNYRLARVLDVTEATVQRWNTGRNLPDDAMCERLASMAGLDVAYVLASIYAERAANDDSRRIWTGIAKRLQATAAAVLTAIVTVWIALAPSGDAQAMARAGAAPVPCESGLTHGIHCRVFTRVVRRLRQRFVRAWHDIFSTPPSGTLTGAGAAA